MVTVYITILNSKVKVKCTLVQWGSVQAIQPMGGMEVLLYSFMTTALEGGEGSASRPGRSLQPGKTQYPLYTRLGGPQDRAEQVRKISPPPPTGIRSPDRPALSQSLYRLSYRAHLCCIGSRNIGKIQTQLVMFIITKTFLRNFSQRHVPALSWTIFRLNTFFCEVNHTIKNVNCCQWELV